MAGRAPEGAPDGFAHGGSAVHICALVAARAGRLALVLGAPQHWREAVGYTLIPAELPGEQVAAHADLVPLLNALALRWLGSPAQPLPNQQVYGPSARHAIDRLPPDLTTRTGDPQPLLRLDRAVPRDDLDAAPDGTEVTADGSLPQHPAVVPVVVRAYRVALSAAATPGAATAGILWLPPAAVRLALRGMPLGELFAAPAVEWQPTAHTALPDDAFIYVPADHGERHLLRIAAKYGPRALFLDDASAALAHEGADA